MTAKELHSYKLDNQVPVFVGPPGHTMYISDKHHLSTAMFEAELELPDHMLHRALYVRLGTHTHIHCVRCRMVPFAHVVLMREKILMGIFAHLLLQMGVHSR